MAYISYISLNELIHHKSVIRDIIIAVVMISVSLYIFVTPRKKYAAEEKIHLASYMPASFDVWESDTYDTSDYRDKWQSINELLVRTYYDGEHQEELTFILEYSSDLRKNFSFHFPEGCHRAGGNEVATLEPLEINLNNRRVLKARCLFIKGRENALMKDDRIVVYWLVIDNKHFYRTFFIKLDQMLAGLLSRANKGFLIRVDYYNGVKYDDQCIQKTRKSISNFIGDLYNSLDENKRMMFFGT